MAVATTSLLDATDLRLLAPLRLAPRRSFSGRVRGERISRQKGVSLEFADYRDYVDGDDLRHLDWNVLARLERPTIRTYQDEDDLAVYVALDASRSMDFGTPTKFSHAARIAAALGYLGLVGQDAVYPIAFGLGDGQAGRPLRGRASANALFTWVDGLQPTGNRGLAPTLRRFATSRARAGMFVLVSDGLDPDAPEALRAVAARGHEIVFVQTLSPLDLDPQLEGDLRLLDSESDTFVEVTAHGETVRAYQQNLKEHCRSLEEETLRGSGRYLQSVVGQPLTEFVTQARRIGVAR